MNENFEALMRIAEHNVLSNPSIVGQDTLEVAKRYLSGLGAEVDEVEFEFKDNNTIYLADELSDIAWDYFVLLKICEKRGWIKSVNDVFEHACEKYTERSPAMIEADQIMWNKIKSNQKENLARKHNLRHG